MKISRVLTYFMVAAVFAFAIFATTIAPPAAQARVFISVGIAPPVIPVYEQPYAPGYGYIWTPGYWAWGEDAYYWVDGAWVLPPYVGALWTPGYWGYGEDAYSWNAGYWGRNIGYYGGINYGFGYFGSGFYGGCWRGDRFFYNGAYNRLGFHDHDDFVYTQRVNGFDGRPGGNAFDRHQDGLNRGDRGRDLNRGATVNGNNFSNRDNNRGNNGADRGMQQTNYRNGFNATGTRPDFNGGARQQYNGGEAATRSFNNGNSVAQSRGSFTPGSPLAQGRGNYAAPQPRSFGGGQSAAPQPRSPGGGGGFQGGGHGNFGGGGGGFQGGGGHAGFSGGGGGSRGGGGGHR